MRIERGSALLIPGREGDGQRRVRQTVTSMGADTDRQRFAAVVVHEENISSTVWALIASEDCTRGICL